MRGQQRSVILSIPMDQKGGIVKSLPRDARVCMVAIAARQAPLVGPDGKKGVEQFPMLFIEGNPDVPDEECVPRKFVAVPKDTVVEGKAGSTVSWVGSAISPYNGAVVHVFEVFGEEPVPAGIEMLPPQAVVYGDDAPPDPASGE